MTMGFIPPYPHEPHPGRMSSRKRWLSAMAIVVVVIAGVAWFLVSVKAKPGVPLETAGPVVVDSLARAPVGTRIRVRVLNTTSKRGLARQATFALRDLGYDVVDFGNEKGDRATTLILAHTARTDWAARLKRAVGTTEIQSRDDSSRYVDFTVLIGRDWQLPAQSFRP